MPIQAVLPAISSPHYPPDFACVARQLFARLLTDDHPGVHLDPDSTWLVFYTLKSNLAPPFTQFPDKEALRPVSTYARQFLRSQTLSDSLLEYFLGHLSLGSGMNFDLRRSVESLAESDRVTNLDQSQIRSLYNAFNSAMEQDYPKQLADYWNIEHGGKTRRSLFITERKKALRMEALLGIEHSQLTVTQYNMLNSALDQGLDSAEPATEKHGVFQLSLQHQQELPKELCGAFVLLHTLCSEPPSLNAPNLGEVLLHTANRGPEGFQSLAAMGVSLAFRAASPVHKQALLRNIGLADRDSLLTTSTPAQQWRLSTERGNVMEAQFDREIKRQQADFSYLVGKARVSGMPREDFLDRLLGVLQQDAQFNNSFFLDRNDRQLMRTVTPDWWFQTATEHRQHWVKAAGEYADAITRLQQISEATPTGPQAETTHNLDWLKHASRLLEAQMRMGLPRAQAEQLPANAQAWIKAVLDNPDARYRAKCDDKVIKVEFVALGEHKLPDVMRIGPGNPGPDDPLLICTVNAPDSRIFRWFPDLKTLREQLIDNPIFARYLLAQIPDEQRVVPWEKVQYLLWLKHHHAPEAFGHLPNPKPLPSFAFGQVTFVEHQQHFLQASHDLKLALFDPPHTSPRASIGSFVASVAINLIPFFLPAPILIALTLGAGLLKVWDGFRHVGENDYKGAAHAFLGAVGYLAIAVGTLLLARIPFSALGSIRTAPPLVRRLGPDGLEHIGFLMSPSTAPRLAELDAVLPYDAKHFQTIEINEDQYFVKSYSNLFGHRELYRRATFNNALLASDGDYAVQGSTGIWRKLSYTGTRTNHWTFNEAERELIGLTTNWPTSVDQISIPEHAAFTTDYLAMAQASNAPELPEIAEYCEGDPAAINKALQSGIRTLATRRFLAEFYCLHEYRSMAFRATHVSTPGLERLLGNVGQVFATQSVQSASVARWGAQQWSLDTFVTQHAAADNQAVFFIFDTLIPKKNLFTSFLGDHVAIAPDTPIQLLSTRTIGGTIYLYFSRPLRVPTKIYDLYSGVEELMV